MLALPVSRLSPREREVCLLLAAGLTQKEAAARLGIAHGTARAYLHRAQYRVGARTIVELVVLVVTGADVTVSPPDRAIRHGNILQTVRAL